MPPFEIGCLLLRFGASFSDWVPPLEIECLLFGLGLSDWVFLLVLYCSSVWPPDFRSLIGVRVRPVQIEYYLQRSYPIEYKGTTIPIHAHCHFDRRRISSLLGDIGLIHIALSCLYSTYWCTPSVCFTHPLHPLLLCLYIFI